MSSDDWTVKRAGTGPVAAPTPPTLISSCVQVTHAHTKLCTAHARPPALLDMDYSAVAVSVREFLKTFFHEEPNVSKIANILDPLVYQWRAPEADAGDVWEVGKTYEHEQEPWAWWVPCSLTGLWRSRTSETSKLESRSAKEIMSMVIVKYNGIVVRTFVGVVYESKAYALNYPETTGNASFLNQKAQQYTTDYVVVQPALSCHGVCIHLGYVRNDKGIDVSVYPASEFGLFAPPSAFALPFDNNRYRGKFAMSRYRSTDFSKQVQEETAEDGSPYTVLSWAFVSVDHSGEFLDFFEENIDEDKTAVLKRWISELFANTSLYSDEDATFHDALSVEEVKETKRVLHATELFWNFTGQEKPEAYFHFKVTLRFQGHQIFGDKETNMFGNLLLHAFRQKLQSGTSVIAPVDDEAIFEVCTTLTSMPGINDLSKGLPDQTYRQRILTAADDEDEPAVGKSSTAPTVKMRTMDAYGHTRVDLERIQVLGKVLRARDVYAAGFRSLHPELQNVTEVLGAQRFLPSISQTTQAITVTPLTHRAYADNVFARSFSRGLKFDRKWSRTNLLYPLSVYTPEFETVHSLMSTEMARLVKHRMQRLHQPDSASDFAHSWMYNAVRGEVWDPLGAWSSGKFHPRIVSSLMAKRENLMDLFYFARMEVSSYLLEMPKDISNPVMIYTHLPFVREIARETLQLYSTAGTIVQPYVNEMCLGQLNRKVEFGNKASQDKLELEIKRQLLEPFQFRLPEQLRIGNLNLYSVAKMYESAIEV